MKKAAILLLLAGLLLACSKRVIPTAPPPPSNLEIQEIDFEYFHGKARMVFNDGKKEREVKAHIRIRKDSVIWMTFTVIGVQGGKALINHDSITIVSTVDKEYYVFDYPGLSKRFNFEVNYHSIQAALLGNLISPREESDKISQGDRFNLLEQQRASVAVRNFINPETKKLEKVEMKEQSTNNSVAINYANFQPIADKTYPFNGIINILYKTPGGLVNTTITLEYSKAEVGDKELKFPFNIPKKYERR
ncbi:MAG: DUF4292 domain-containing protein [Cyclobacteriaceae bacterium]|nr:DUF4292 domain-containing protein [Cyclobacteriaceae bacterium]